MNEILEALYPDKGVVKRRQAQPIPQLLPRTDLFSAYLHEEMRQCWLNGHDHAAIVIACAVTDSGIKDAIYLQRFIQANCKFDPDEWDEIDGMEFGHAISRAKKAGVITKDEWEQLDWLRVHIRNVYLHGQTPPWIKDKEDTLIEGDLGTGEAKELTVQVRDHIVLQRHVRILADRNICDQVVRLVDALLRKLVACSKSALVTFKGTSASRPTVEQVERVLADMESKGLEADVIITNALPDRVDGGSARGASSQQRQGEVS